MHVLVIEDELMLCLDLEETLRKAGFTSFDYASGVESALTNASKRRPDLIIADQTLSDGTGVEAVTSICSDHPIGVVFVTANPSIVRETMPDAIVISKPYVDAMLHLAVTDALERPFRPTTSDGSRSSGNATRK